MAADTDSKKLTSSADTAPEKSASDTASDKDYVKIDDDALGPAQQILRRDEYWDRIAMCWQLVEPKKDLKQRKLQKHVLLVRRVFDKNMTPTHIEVDVTGPILRQTLINIFTDAPGFPLTAKKRTLNPEWFFWARQDLNNIAQHCKEVGDEDTLFEIEAGLLFVAEHHNILLAELTNVSLITNISYLDLWTIFPPNTLVYGQDALEQDRVWRVTKGAKKCKEDGSSEFRIESEFIESDGIKVGMASASLVIPSYDGSVTIDSLPYKPLHLLPQREKIWQTIPERTEKQLSFLSMPFKMQEHEGEGVVLGHPDTPAWEQKEPQRFYFRGRVMIDPIKYRAVEQAPLIPPINKLRELSYKSISMGTSDGRQFRCAVDLMPDLSSLEVDDLCTPIHEDPNAIDPFAYNFPPPPTPIVPGEVTNGFGSRRLTTEDLQSIAANLTQVDKLLFSGLLYGFSLNEARWAAFSATRVSDVQWRKDMLSSLVISAPVLNSMRQLIQSHSTRSPFDDFVPGKGQGLIGLFSGQPGLGKTFTAEAIAETAEKPLYSVSSGALGSSASDINTKLRSIMNLCAHWQAVLLLDEADVFLAKRTINDLDRNSIVSVFLRELEYYPGIMILTTNQPEIIDPAFQSRIHFCYRYPSLDWRARRQIWLQFIEKAETSLGPARVNVDASGLGELAELAYNGRQIKNAVSIALTLAGREGLVTTESIIEVCKTLQAFDFSAPSGDEDSDEDE